MLYRSFPGDPETKLSILGFGCMRLPQLSKKAKDIDREKASAMIRNAIDSGVNYIDTAWPYHGGMSEVLLADVLADGYREKVYLATKLPSWMIKKEEDMDRILDKQLDRLNTNYIDYYLLHALNRKYWDNLTANGVFRFIKRALDSGKVRHIGFSFHDKIDVFKEIVDAYDWDFCQIQYNYLDTENQAGTEGLEYAHNKGMGVVVMEPLRGGSLTKVVPDDIREIWNSTDAKKSPAEWALRWVWNDPRVSVVLSGMSTEDQVAENLAIANTAEADTMPARELETINAAARIYKERMKVNCTACGYCMPCPHGVNIPSVFRFYNQAYMFDDIESNRIMNERVNSESGADLCIQCGECEPKCPQDIPIIDSLQAVRELFYEN